MYDDGEDDSDTVDIAEDAGDAGAAAASAPDTTQADIDAYAKQLERRSGCGWDADTRDAWRRPRPGGAGIKQGDAIDFMLTDAEYVLSAPTESECRLWSAAAGSPTPPKRAPIVRLFGTTAAGESVLLRVHGFCPYFYASVSTGSMASDPRLDDDSADFDLSMVSELYKELGSALEDKLKNRHADSPTQTQWIVDQRCEYKTSIRGYAFGKPKLVVRFEFADPSIIHKAKRTLEDGLHIRNGSRWLRPPLWQFDTYESKCDYTLRFMIDRAIVGCGWVTVDANAWPSTRPSPPAQSSCQFEADVWHREVRGQSGDEERHTKIAPIVTLSFDIECEGRPHIFPDPQFDPVVQIACVATAQGRDEPLDRIVFALKSVAPLGNGARLVYFDSEHDLLGAFYVYVGDLDPDVLTGYNIINFDVPYLVERAQALGITRFPFLGRIRGERTTIRAITSGSKQTGIRETKRIKYGGRVYLDMLPLIQRDYKLSAYSLNAVAAHFLGDQKEDVHHTEISTLQQTSAETRRRLALYCLKDADLPCQLIRALFTIEATVGHARVNGVLLNTFLACGQQVRVMSLIMRKARLCDVILPTVAASAAVAEGGFEGATVLEPKCGFYKMPVATLDFASLYPSIMMAHNLDYMTLVRKDQLHRLDPSQYTVSPSGAAFVKAHVHKGLLPQILQELGARRTQAKRALKEEKAKPAHLRNKARVAELDKRQLALKVSANSCYGFTGATVGQLPCLDISRSVTAFGREGIETTRTAVMAHYPGSEVIYGDSVTGDTPLLFKLPTGAIGVTTFAQVVQDSAWTAYDNFKPGEPERTHKQQALLPGVLVWACDRWAPIVRAIRHKTHKRIVRVLTHTGLVDCTEDHSLLTPDGVPIKPADCAVGTPLLHGLPPLAEFATLPQTGLSAERAFLMGCFVGEGSCREYDCPSDGKASWYIGKNDVGLLERCGRAMETQEGLGYKILDTAKSSQTPRLVPVGAYGAVAAFVREYRSLFYDASKRKFIPPYVLNATEEARRAFLAGFYATDGDKTGGCRLDQRGQVGCQGLVVLLHSLGHTVSINTRADKPDIFRMTWFSLEGGKHTSRRPLHRIKKIYPLRDTAEGEFVYDLETGEGRFNAGIGALTVKNTDSVMIKFKDADLAESLRLGLEAAAYVTNKHFISPIKLEFEKCYHPYLLMNKKRFRSPACTLTLTLTHSPISQNGDPGRWIHPPMRRYAGLLWTNADKYDYLDVKGTESARRDNCSLVRTVQNQILNQTLIEGDPEGALESVRGHLRALASGKTDMHELVISKSLSKSKAEYDKVGAHHAHVECAERVRRRDPGGAYAVGDRVQYVMTVGPAKAKAYECAEDPVYVLKEGLQVDFDWYVEHQLLEPIRRIYERVLTPDVLKELLTGAHTRVRTKRSTGSAGILRYTTPALTCLCCRAPIPKHSEVKVVLPTPAERDARVRAMTVRALRYESGPSRPPSSDPRRARSSSPCAGEGVHVIGDSAWNAEWREALEGPTPPRVAETCGKAVCADCEPDATEEYLRRATAASEAQGRFGRLWSQCLRCKGDATKDVNCSARHCPIFYARTQARIDVATTTQTLERFDW